MAAEFYRKCLIVVSVQFGVFISLILQCYGFVLAYKIFQQKRVMIIRAQLSLRKRKWVKKMNHLMYRRICRKPRTIWVENGRTEQWWINMENGISPPSAWKKNFRMTKENFDNLVAELHPVIGPKPNSPNYRFLSTAKKLAVTLYYLKDTGSLWVVANTFGIHQCTVTKTIMEVCTAINTLLGPAYIHLPRNKEEMRNITSQFALKFGMTQAFGCIDGTHVQVKRPESDSQDFFNYKQYFSLNIQAVCDSNGYFIDVECMWPGSVHDAKVFANSSVSKNLTNGQLPVTYLTLIPGCNSVSSYLIGDPAYPLTKFCIKEYQSCSNNAEVIFNNMLRSARNQVECAFGRLKARWRFLTRKIDLKLESVPTVAYTCFILHNYCERNHDTSLNEDEIRLFMAQQKADEDAFPNLPDQVYSYNNAEGENVRSILTDYIAYNLPDNY